MTNTRDTHTHLEQCPTPSMCLDTVSNPVNATLFTWESLWSHPDIREICKRPEFVTGFLRLIEFHGSLAHDV